MAPTTADDVITEARRWLGTHEQPLGSNNVPGITDWYGLRGAWCAMFVSRVFYDAGMPLPASTSKGFAWVSAGFDWMRRQGWYVFTNWRLAEPGDLVAWEWGSTPGGFDHISIVEAQGPFTTIGGNERDFVKREFYGSPGGAALFARPPYAVPPTPTPPPPAPAPSKEIDYMARHQLFQHGPGLRLMAEVGIGAFGITTIRTQTSENSGFTQWFPLHSDADPQPFAAAEVTAATNADGRVEIVAYAPDGRSARKVRNLDGSWRAWATES